MQILVKIVLQALYIKSVKGKRVLNASMQMWSQVNTFTVFSCLLPPVASFSQSTIVGEQGSTAPDSGGQPTSSPPLNTFEHIFLCTAGPCPVLWPDHPLLLVDQTCRARSLQAEAGQDSFQASHRGISMPRLGGGGCIKAKLQIPHELDLCQQIKMLFDLLTLYI